MSKVNEVDFVNEVGLAPLPEIDNKKRAAALGSPLLFYSMPEH